MKLPRLLALPPTIILLCAAGASAEPQWPHNLPRHMKYFPEEEAHVRRGLEVQEKLRREKPIGVKKMSTNEGEMFLLDYWIFASDMQTPGKRSEVEQFANLTAPFTSPLRPNAKGAVLDSYLHVHARDALMQRGFKCPSGTNDCSSIGAPDSCCGTGSSCVKISDTGFGPVGCCPSGQTCGGGISCDTSAGYTSCPESPNGGCCLPGYSCMGVGCECSQG